MAILPEKGPLWWDRDSDRMGRPIRQDVRVAAREVWEHARSRARAVLGDDTDAAEMMEASVERVSHYLNRQEVPLFSANAAGLLTTAFRRQAQKRWRKQQRLELVGGASDLEGRCHGPDWSKNIDRTLDLKKIIRCLSPRSIRMLLRRRDGIDWKSISAELGISEQTAQNSFWREVRQAQLDLLKMHRGTKEIPTSRSSSGGGKEASHEKESPFPPRRKGRSRRAGID